MSATPCRETIEIPMLGSPPTVQFVCTKDEGHTGEHDWRPAP